EVLADGPLSALQAAMCASLPGAGDPRVMQDQTELASRVIGRGGPFPRRKTEQFVWIGVMEITEKSMKGVEVPDNELHRRPRLTRYASTHARMVGAVSRYCAAYATPCSPMPRPRPGEERISRVRAATAAGSRLGS